MSFQLVRASENEIAIWHTEHGHIFVFQVCPDTNALRLVVARDAPDADVPASSFADEALRFATQEAALRQMLRPYAMPPQWRCASAHAG